MAQIGLPTLLVPPSANSAVARKIPSHPAFTSRITMRLASEVVKDAAPGIAICGLVHDSRTSPSQLASGLFRKASVPEIFSSNVSSGRTIAGPTTLN